MIVQPIWKIATNYRLSRNSPSPDFDNTIDFVQSPKILQTLTIFKNHFIIESKVAVNEITISSTNDKVDIFFLNTITGSGILR